MLNDITRYNNIYGFFNIKEYYYDSFVKLNQFYIFCRVKPTLIRKYNTEESSKRKVNLNIENFYESFPSLSEENKHLYITKNIQDASLVLKDMYSSLSDADPVKLYLDKNGCLHLLS